MPSRVTEKLTNSSKRVGLNCSGASQPGKLGSRMIAVIWWTKRGRGTEEGKGADRVECGADGRCFYACCRRPLPV